MPDYKEYFIIAAEPDQVYRALTTEITLQLWTGAPARMQELPDTEFSLWDGDIVGRNIAFEPGKMITQHWYFGEENPESVVTIKLHPHKQGTSMEVRQLHIPEESYDDIVDGWRTVYIASLRDFYEG